MKALPSSDQQLVYQMTKNGLITSLPYIDTQPNKKELKEVRKLINAERKYLVKKSDYISKLDGLIEDLKPPKTTFLDSLTKDNAEYLGKRSEPSKSNGDEQEQGAANLNNQKSR